MRPKQVKIISVLLLMALLIVSGAVTVRRTLKGSNDFDTYYKAGQQALLGRAQTDAFNGRGGIYYFGEEEQTSPFLYLPVIACFFALFAILPVSLAAFLWNALLLVAFFVCGFVILNFYDSPYSTFFRSVQKWDFILLIGVASAMLLDNLTMAQINIIILLLLACMMLLWKKNRSFGAGLVLAAAVMIKATPLLFLIYFAVKRQWRLLFGCLTGFIFFVLLIPSLVYGVSLNKIYHRQWLGRTVKPMMIEMMERISPGGEVRPGRKTAEQIRSERLTGNLNAANQSLEAVLTRFFLKDRNAYRWAGSYPIEVIDKIQKLPVIGGGFRYERLRFLIRFLQLLILIVFVTLLLKNASHGQNNAFWTGTEASLVLLLMTLFAPWARSQQFVLWLWPMLSALLLKQHLSQTTFYFFWWSIRIGLMLYLLQAVPYGQAAGFGAWANLMLVLGFAAVLFSLNRELKDSR